MTVESNLLSCLKTACPDYEKCLHKDDSNCCNLCFYRDGGVCDNCYDVPCSTEIWGSCSCQNFVRLTDVKVRISGIPHWVMWYTDRLNEVYPLSSLDRDERPGYNVLVDGEERYVRLRDGTVVLPPETDRISQLARDFMEGL